MEIRILQLADRDAILQYERQKLALIQSDEFERQMLEWHAKWRNEALEHYLPMGWSFGTFAEGQLTGYFLAQPQVFTRGMTQSLWLEHVQFETPQTLGLLIEVASKLCREKNFQKLLMLRSDEIENGVRAAQMTEYEGLIQRFESTNEPCFTMVTSKIQGS